MKRRKMWWRKNDLSRVKILQRVDSNKLQTWRDNWKLLERKQLQMSSSMKKMMIVQSANRV